MARKKKSGRIRRRLRNGRRLPAYIEVVPDLEVSFRDALKLESGDVGHDGTPLADGLSSDAKSRGNGDLNGRLAGIRIPKLRLKVLEGGRLEHSDANVTTVTQEMQPKLREMSDGSSETSLSPGGEHSKPRLQGSTISFPSMDALPTFAERLRDAMRSSGVSQTELASHLNISHVAVGKWLKGGVPNADNLAAVARNLGVRPDWLRTGRLPRQPDRAHEEREIDEAIDLLLQMRGPLLALSAVMDRLAALRATPARARHK